MTGTAEALDTIPVIASARAAMAQLYRRRMYGYAASLPAGPSLAGQLDLAIGSIGTPEHAPSVSAIDLAAYLDQQGIEGERRWCGVVFTAPRGLWHRIGYIPNPRRHNSPTPMFALDENRAQELGL